MHHNTTNPSASLSFASPPSNFLCHPNATVFPWSTKDPGGGGGGGGGGGDVMFLFHASSILSFLLLLIHLSSFLLANLFKFIYRDAIFGGSVVQCTQHELEPTTSADEKEDLVADILGGETLLFLRRGSVFDDNLLFEQGIDCEDAVDNLEGGDTFVSESAYDSPMDEKNGIEYNDDVSTTTNDLVHDLDPEECALEGKYKAQDIAFVESTDTTKILQNSDGSFHEDEDQIDEGLDTIKIPLSCGKKLLQVEEDRDYFGGSLTGESTSKSSVEWRSSNIFRDSETDYSSSRKSSSRWESYAMFRKYDEEMLFFDRITAQKLSETESLRSIKVHPRSISERIVHKLSIKPIDHTLGGSRRDPYEELESAYVAQICLTWEALSWNYTNFRQKNSSSCNTVGSGCPARIAQHFQEFQVLLQRFIENEPYEYGRRPEVYARRRISSPKLLQVPEFRDSEGDEVGKEDTSPNISSDEFVAILEDAIRTFMNFLKADKEKCADKVRAFIRRKTSSPDPIFHQFLKKANKKKKLKLCNMIGKRQCSRCLRKRKLKHEEEMEVVMGLIDLKVVSRVLRMTEINTEQLHWCEEKMGKVRVWDGKMKRDSSPLFFPYSTLAH